MSSKNPEQLSPEVMRQFTGSEHWYRGTMNRNVVFTDGAKHVADYGGAYWLLDEIALAQLHVKAVKAEEFQVLETQGRYRAHTGTLTCEDGNGNKVFEKALEFTDFPSPKSRSGLPTTPSSAERILNEESRRGTALFGLSLPLFQPTGVKP